MSRLHQQFETVGLTVQDSDNSSYVVHVRESLSFRNHLCISFELLSINL